MRYYAIQTNMTMQEVHEKLWLKPWMECVIAESFDENEEQIYITSIKRINDNSIGDFTKEELMVELSSHGINGDDFDEFIDTYNNDYGDQDV